MSGKIIDKVKYFIGLDVFEEDEVPEDEITFQHEEMTPVLGNNKKNKVLNIHTTTQMKVVIYEPSNFDEAPGIVDNLKNRKPVIINLENIDSELAKSFLIF